MFLHESCGLRPMVKSDLVQVLEWRNQERIRSNMYTTHVISKVEHQAWFESLDSVQNRYFVFECEGMPSGLTYFTHIDPDHGRAEWGFYLGQDDLPCGCGTVMGALSLDLAFGELGLRKVYGEVLEYNHASRKFFDRLRFKCDGLMREHVCRDGEYVGVVLFSQTGREWKGGNREVIFKMIETWNKSVV